MPLIDDLAEPVAQEDLDRRKFLGLLGAGAMAVATAGTAIVAVKYIAPNVLYEADTRVRIGRPDTIPVGTLVVLPRQKLFVMHAADGFFAMSAVCTHLGCMTQHEPDRGRIFCPCHGSQYALDGKVTQGPAPAPLPRFEVLLDRGDLVVDTAKVVERDVLLKA